MAAPAPASDPEPWQRALHGRRLLVSGFGKWGGGVYDLTSGVAVAFDDLPTSGMTLGDGRLWRVLRAPGEQTATCELLSYDERGVRSYRRLDDIRDPHDVCWHEGAVLIVSSWDAIVWRLEPGEGSPQPLWRGGAVPDSWHPNSLVVVDGRLHVCAFGRFDRHKDWKAEGNKTSGFVHDTVREVDVLTGLGHPHTPRVVDDRWYVCQSTSGELIEYDLTGREQRRLGIRRFSRGLGIVGRWAFVGGNAHRAEPDDRAEIVIVDREDLEIVDRIAMPCLEVYDILAVPFELARGVALGFGANPARAVEQHRGSGRVVERRPTAPDARVQLIAPRVAARLAEPGRVLDRRVAARFRVSVALPITMTAGSTQVVRATVQNRSRLALASVVPHPVRVGARWWAADSGQDADGPPDLDHTIPNPLAPLPRLLHPGESVDTDVVLTAPDRPGRYHLRVTLHQPGFGWFGRRTQCLVTVEADVEAESRLSAS